MGLDQIGRLHAKASPTDLAQIEQVVDLAASTAALASIQASIKGWRAYSTLRHVSACWCGSGRENHGRGSSPHGRRTVGVLDAHGLQLIPCQGTFAEHQFNASFTRCIEVRRVIIWRRVNAAINNPVIIRTIVGAGALSRKKLA